MPSGNYTVTVRTRISKPRRWLVLLFAWLFGTQHRLTAWLWTELRPIQIKVANRDWEPVAWAKVLELCGE